MMLIWLSIAYAQDKDVSEQIVGNCDEQNVCVVNFNNSDSHREKLCTSPDFSVLWYRGSERYLFQCRSESTSEENTIWIVDKKTDFFGKLHFGRFIKKSALEANPSLKIQDRFQSRILCNPAELSKVKASDFVLLDKKPMDNNENYYCYDPVYLSILDNRLKIENGSGFFNSRDVEHAIHKVSLEDKDSLLYLLKSLQK